MQFLANIDLSKNELQNARIQNLSTHPANPVPGQFYYNTTDKTPYIWDGSVWIDLGVVFSNKDILDSITAAFTTALKNKLDGISTGANKVENSATNGNIKIDGVEKTVYTHPGSGTNPHGTTKADVGLGSVENKSSATIRGELTSSNVTSALGFTPIKNGGSTSELRSGNEVTRPAATGSGMVYFATDTKKIYKDTASGVWTQMGGQDSLDWSAITGKPSTFTPPVATATELGGIKVGANLTVTADGTLNANDNPASFIRKQERFTVSTGQTVFNLTKGTYKPNTGAITWFLNGDKQDDRALSETSSTSVTLPSGLPTGSEVLFEYYEVINWHPFPTHANEHLTGGADPIPVVTTTTDGLMISSDKSKLDGIEAGAEVNDPAFKTIAVSGQSSVVADVDADTLTLVAGSNVTIITNASTDSITITAKDTTYTLATTGADGLMSSTDKSKMDGIEAGANNYVHPTSHPASMITGLSTVATSGSYNDLSNKPTLGTVASKNTGTTNGTVPVIGSDGKLDSSIMPAIAITDTFVVNTQVSMLALTAQVGDIAVRTDLSKSFILKSEPASTLANWQELLTPTDVVTSVAGKTGAVTLGKSDVGLSNVDNVQQASKSEFNTHNGDNTRHITSSERTGWNNKVDKYSALIGNGSATSFSVTHNLNTQDVTVTIRENVSPYNVVFADVQVTNVNAITVLFANAPTSNQFKVIVTG